MYKKLNIQFLLSYAGLIPFFLVILDKFYFFNIAESAYFNFIINYTLIILVFVGATNWNLNENIRLSLVLHGFLPSLFALIIFVLKSFYVVSFHFLISLILFLFFQLISDYFLIYSEKNNRKPFYKLRLPLSIIISICLMLIIL